MTVKMQKIVNDNLEEIQVICNSLSELDCLYKAGYKVVETDGD